MSGWVIYECSATLAFEKPLSLSAIEPHRHAWHMSRPRIQIKIWWVGLLTGKLSYTIAEKYMGMGAEWKRCPVARVADNDHE